MKHFCLPFLTATLLTGCIDPQEDYSKLYEPFPEKFILQLEIEGNQGDTLEVELVVNPTLSIEKSKRIQTRFIINDQSEELEVYIDRPAHGHLYIGNEQFTIAIKPNAKSVAKYNAQKKEISFQNEDKEISAINLYYLRKKEFLGYADFRRPYNHQLNNVSNFESITNFVDSLTSIELSFLKGDVTTSNLPKWFIDYENAEINYQNLSIKTELPMINEVFGFIKVQPPYDYFSFLDTISLNNESAILASNYFSFLDNFFMKDLPLDSFNSHAGFRRHQINNAHRLKYSKVELTGNVKSIYHRSKFSRMMLFYNDSSEIDSLAKEFEVSNYYALLRLAGSDKKTNTNVIKIKNGDLLPKMLLLDEKDSLISVDELSTGVTYINIWATWCGPCIQNFPQHNEMINSFSGKDIQFINICLSSKKDHWRVLIDKHNIQGINLFAEGNWNQKIIDGFGLASFPHYAIIRNNTMIENNVDKAPFIEEKLLELSLK